jgi:hypothetical protein
MFAPQITGLQAGADLDVAAPCYIKSSDGKVYMSDATAANEAAEIVGWTPRAVKLGQAVTLYGKGARFHYSDGLLTPGDIYFTGATAGRLDTAAQTGCAFAIAQAITAYDIRVVGDETPLTSATVGAGTITATELASNAVITVKILDANVTEAKIALASLTGTVAALVANANVIGGIPVIHRLTLTSGANGDTDILLTHKTRVAMAWFVLKGAGTAGCLVTVKNVANAITEALDCAAGADKAQYHFASYDDAYFDVAAGTNLRVSKASTGANFPGAEVYVLGFRTA